MIRLPRFRTRPFLALVALLAVAIMAPGERRNWLTCSTLEIRGRWFLERAGSHDRERVICHLMRGRGAYDFANRHEFLPELEDAPTTGFPGWDEEAAFHAEQAIVWRRRADDFGTLIRQRRARLVIPWLLSRLK